MPELLAHLLVGGPASAPGSRREQPYAGDPVRRAEIGNVERADAVAPDVAGELLQRRDASLGKVPIPLSPERLLAVGEVEGIDDVAALPAVAETSPVRAARRRGVALGQRVEPPVRSGGLRERERRKQVSGERAQRTFVKCTTLLRSSAARASAASMPREHEHARRLGVEGRSKMSKQELARTIAKSSSGAPIGARRAQAPGCIRAAAIS